MENSDELAILLEDNVDIAPGAYKWLKAAHIRNTRMFQIMVDTACLKGL